MSYVKELECFLSGDKDGNVFITKIKENFKNSTFVKEKSPIVSIIYTLHGSTVYIATEEKIKGYNLETQEEVFSYENDLGGGDPKIISINYLESKLLLLIVYANNSLCFINPKLGIVELQVKRHL